MFPWFLYADMYDATTLELFIKVLLSSPKNFFIIVATVFTTSVCVFFMTVFISNKVFYYNRLVKGRKFMESGDKLETTWFFF